jgi:hypothetical protein
VDGVVSVDELPLDPVESLEPVEPPMFGQFAELPP